MPRYFPVEGEISGLYIASKRAVIEDVSLAGTAFNNCSIHPPRKPADRAVLRRITVGRVHHWACRACGALFDDVTVTDIRGGGRAPSFLWACAYHHVTLRGSIGGLMFRWQLNFKQDEGMSASYHEANLALYESMDWAIDVSEAKFTSTESLIGIPPHLVRRDPATQFLLTRTPAEVILRDRPHSVWSVIAERLIDSGMPGVVVAVGGRGERLRADLDAARTLTDEGLLM